MSPYLKSRGFTLIELLVVISIIALLIAILLPALGAVRRSAELTQCASGMHQIGVGAMAYAVDNDNELPKTVSAFNPAAPVRHPYETRIATSIHYNPEDKESSIAALWDGGYIETPEIFYCPSQTSEKLVFSFNKDATGQWGINPSSFALRMAYMWNPNDKNDARGILYDQVDQMRSDYLLMIDTVESVEITAHIEAKGFNAMRADGSVAFESSSDGWEALEKFTDDGTDIARLWDPWNEIVDKLLDEYPEGRND
ncbi:MAG: prepilin-type N-terminal cleavage/methylation domain-containing protein [Planctomycetota bacterium]